jgi:hypothetical protein
VVTFLLICIDGQRSFDDVGILGTHSVVCVIGLMTWSLPATSWKYRVRLALCAGMLDARGADVLKFDELKRMDREEYSEFKAVENGFVVRRIRDSKGSVIAELKVDSMGRECQRMDFDGDGHCFRRTVYEYDADDCKPRLTLGYDMAGKLVFRHERGKRPELFG